MPPLSCHSQEPRGMMNILSFSCCGPSLLGCIVPCQRLLSPSLPLQLGLHTSHFMGTAIELRP